MPASMSGFIDMVGFAIFTILIGRAGAVALATSQIQVQILSFSFMPMWGLTIAGSVLMGNLVGKGDHDKAEMYGKQTYKMGLYYSLTLAVILVLLGGNVYKIFTPDPAILAFAATMVPLAALFQVFDGARMIGNGLLTGAGDTKPTMLIAFFVGWLVFLPLTWYLVVYHNGSVAVAWIGSVVCYAIRSALLYGRFLSGKWRHVDLWK
jgi:MATE family multidrug resistance protein